MQPLQRVVPATGRNWEACQVTVVGMALERLTRLLLKRKKQVGIQYVQPTRPNPMIADEEKKDQRQYTVMGHLAGSVGQGSG